METSTLKTRDGLTLHTVAWRAETPRAVVLLVHGIGEHSGRYGHVAQALNDAGFSVYAIDHRGHGRSEGQRTLFESFDQPVEDVRLYFDVVRAANPQARIFIYGHSMGSLISTLFCQRYQDLVAGFISTGSPLAIDEGKPQLMISVLSLVARALPTLRLDTVGVGIEALSHDPEVITAYKVDPLIDSQPTPLGMAARLVQTARLARARLYTLTLPILALHGTGDQVCPPSGSKMIQALAASPDKSLKLYDGLYHEIHNEPEKATVFADIIAWLNARV